MLTETARLTIRPYSLADLEELIEMRSDPEIYRYLGGLERQNPTEIAKRLRFYIDCYQEYGFGMAAMILKENGENIGGSGLQPLEQTGEIEVGYSLKRAYWGRGIGTECALEWLRYGFESAGLERIVAVTSPDNIGSWRVMEKCGMKFEGLKRAYNMECKFYAISKNEFMQRETVL